MEKDKIKVLHHIPIKKVMYDDVYRDLINQEYEIELDGKKIHFKIEDFEKKSFQKILIYLDQNDLQKVISQGHFSNSIPSYYSNFMSEDDINLLMKTQPYYSKDSHLGLNYFIKDGYLVVLSYGEKQPSRWILYVEGVWEVNFPSNLDI